MIPWETVDPATPLAVDGDLSLHRRGDEWSIRSRGVELMNSRRFGSERSLATCAAQALANARPGPVLIGGLGMGHTLRAALDAFPAAAIVVAEIAPRVVAWNRGHLAALADAPLEDPRCRVLETDVREPIETAACGDEADRYAAILLDVDNGPEALSQATNLSLYAPAGLAAIRSALRSGGVAGFWSAGPSREFERRLARSGFDVATHRVPIRLGRRGRARHTVWIAGRT